MVSTFIRLTDCHSALHDINANRLNKSTWMLIGLYTTVHLLDSFTLFSAISII